MKVLITMIAWVMVNGFPIASFESCEVAQGKADELQRENKDLMVGVDCEASERSPAEQQIDYYGPRAVDMLDEEHP